MGPDTSRAEEAVRWAIRRSHMLVLNNDGRVQAATRHYQRHNLTDERPSQEQVAHDYRAERQYTGGSMHMRSQ